MGRPAYWQCAPRGLAWRHWAMRTAAVSGASSRGEHGGALPQRTPRSGGALLPACRCSRLGYRRSYDASRWSSASSSLRRAATAPASSAPSRRSSWRSSTTGRPSTSASRSSTTSTSSAISRRAAPIFVDSEDEAPEGATIVFSAHGVAPAVHDASAGSRPQRDRRDVPARDEGARAGAAVRRRRLHRRPHRPRGPRGGRRDDGRGARGDRPRPGRRRGRGARASAGRAGRLHHADDALGRRDGRDHRRPPPALPADPRAEEGGHLLRDLQPAVGGEGDARARSTCCS